MKVETFCSRLLIENWVVPRIVGVPKPPFEKSSKTKPGVSRAMSSSSRTDASLIASWSKAVIATGTSCTDSSSLRAVTKITLESLASASSDSCAKAGADQTNASDVIAPPKDKFLKRCVMLNPHWILWTGTFFGLI